MSGQFPGMILADADFMIHGVFKYTLFGQELYITTTHVAMFIVTIIILIIMICAHHTMKHAKQIPGIPEYHRDVCSDHRQYGCVYYGQERKTLCELYLCDIHVYTVLQPVRSVRTRTRRRQITVLHYH